MLFRSRSEFQCGPWFADPTDRLVQELFTSSRPIGYKGRTVFMPFIELANHGAGRAIVTNGGVELRGLFPGEVLVRYAEFDPHGVFVIWGFAADQPQVFFITAELEAYGLLDPERVGDQLFLSLGGFHLLGLPRKPEQSGQEEQ